MTKPAFLLKIRRMKNYREKNMNYYANVLTCSKKKKVFVSRDNIKLYICHKYFHFSKNF